MNRLVGPHEPLLSTVRRRESTWFGHVTRHNSLSKSILQGTLQSGQLRGRQRKCWLDNIKEWTSVAISETARDGLPLKGLEDDLS